MAQMTGYAASAYVAQQTQGMSQQQMLLQLYDFAVAGCVARDGRKATAAIVELIAALNFDYEEIATGLDVAGKARVTRRLRQQIGVDCQSMPTSHAAVRHGVSWGKARRAEKAFLAEWDRTRPKRQPRHIGLDEIQRGKGQRFWTVLSDVVHGEVMGLRPDRTEAAATALLTEELTARQRGAITAACTDMHRPYLNAVGAVLTHAEVVFDKECAAAHSLSKTISARLKTSATAFRYGRCMSVHTASTAARCRGSRHVVNNVRRLSSLRSLAKPITSPRTTSDSTVQNCWPLPRWISSAPRYRGRCFGRVRSQASRNARSALRAVPQLTACRTAA